MWCSKRDVVAVAHQAMTADGETVTVDLETMPQPRLDDALAALDLADQAVDVGDEIVVDAGQVGRHDRAEQQAAEARRRVDRQHHVPERDAARRHCGTGVPDLELSEQHRAVARSLGRSDVRPDDRAECLGEPDHLRLVDAMARLDRRRRSAR